MLNQLRQQFGKFWDSQSRIQRIVLVVLVATGMVLVPLFMMWATTPSYAVAYSGLSEADAGLIVEKLIEEDILYQLRDNGTILVETSNVYDVRLMMARQGLPEGGTVGFELFNGNTLGMTEFTQRVNYQQAMEGELERTIGSLTPVEAVRVHIVTPEKTLLAGDQAPSTASITIKEKPGMHLDTAQVRSITHLVASSLEGLKPENVVVVDVNGNLLASGETSGDAAMTGESDNRRVIELMAARELQTKVQNLLDTALGPNKSVVQASVTMDWTQREKTTQSFQPDTIAVRSSQDVTETYTTTNGTLEGVPGAVSNLPPAGSGTISDNQAVKYNRVEHTTNYEVTQVEAREVESPGAVKKISLSVLVDGVTDTTQLTTLQSVIAAAAGIDETRGDLLAVESLAFDRTYYETQAADLVEQSKMDLYIQIGVAVAAVLLLFLLFWYVSRLLNNLKLVSAQAWTPILKPVGEMALSGGTAGGYTPQQLQTSGDRPIQQQLEQYMAKSEPQPEPAKQVPQAKYEPKFESQTLSPQMEQLQSLIQDLADQDPASLAGIIQLWLSEDDRGNG